jgi:plasmid stabilization system protein ParE
MPRGDKSAYTDKQKRQAEHIEEGYEKQGVSAKTAARRAWATVNKQDGGGKKSGSGRKTARKSTARKAPAKKPAARKSSARKSTARKSPARKRSR